MHPIVVVLWFLNSHIFCYMIFCFAFAWWWSYCKGKQTHWWNNYQRPTTGITSIVYMREFNWDPNSIMKIAENITTVTKSKWCSRTTLSSLAWISKAWSMCISKQALEKHVQRSLTHYKNTSTTIASPIIWNSNSFSL